MRPIRIFHLFSCQTSDPGGELEVEAAARRDDRGADGPVQEDGPGVWPDKKMPAV